MRLLSATTLCLLCTLLAQAADGPVPVLDTGGHTAAVSQVLFAPDGKTLYSISLDRTVRVWDASSGRCLRTLRPPIVGHTFGHLSRAALSANGQLLAVAGNTSQDERTFDVYLLAPAVPRMQQVLNKAGHTAPITALCFSSGGELLASGSVDRSVRVWTVKSGECRVLETGADRVTGLAFSPDGKLLAVATPLGGRILALEAGKPAVVLRDAGKLHDIAWSADGKTIAAACDSPPSIGLWSADGSLRKRLPLAGIPLSCAFQGGLILAGLSVHKADTPRYQYGAALLDAESGQVKVQVLNEPVEQRFSAIDTEAGSAALAPATGLIATVGGVAPAISLWRQVDGSRLRDLAGKGRPIWSVGWGYDSQSFAWGDEGKIEDLQANRPRALRAFFELPELKREAIPLEQYRLVQQAAEDPAIEGSVRTGEFFKRNSPILTRLFDARCGILLPGGLAAIGSPIRIDPRRPFAPHPITLHSISTGTEQGSLEGHRGPVNALSVSRDGNYLLSGSEDQTLTIWGLTRKQRLLSLFCSDDDWVAWTPEGFYAASASGERLLGWHVNQADQLAHFYPASDFHPSLCRPVAVQELLHKGGLPGDRAAAKSIQAVLPPHVVLLRPEQDDIIPEGATVQIKARAEATSAEHPISALQLLVDGRPDQVADGLKKNEAPAPIAEAAWDVRLVPGEHVIAVQAQAAEKVESDWKIVSTSQSVERKLVCRGAPTARRQRTHLHVLAIGIPQTGEKTARERTAQEAETLVDAIKKHSQALFDVDGSTLVNGDATRAAVLERIGRLEKAMKTGDVAVVFFAGPGERTSDGRYYLVPAGYKPDDLASTALDSSRLLDRLQRMGGQAVLLLDCFPLPKRGDGRTASTDTPGPTPVPEEVVQAAVQDVRGVSVLRSSIGVDLAPEQAGPASTGFVMAVAEGLAGKADTSGEGEIDLDELGAYVRSRVKELSKGRLQPKLDRPLGAQPLILGRIAGPKPTHSDPPQQPQAQAGTDQGGPPSADKAVIEIDLPPGGRVIADGVDYGDRKRLSYDHLRAGAVQKHELRIVARGGEEVVRSVLLRGGWRVHLSAAGRPAGEQPELVVQTGHARGIHAVALSSDGKRMVTGGKDRVALLWETDSGKKVRAFRGHSDIVQAVAFSPDGKYVLTGSTDETAILWETVTGKQVRAFKGHSGPVFAVAFSPDGQHVLTGSDDQTAMLWKTDTAERVQQFQGHKGAVYAAVFSPDGKHVLTGGADSKAILWQTGSARNERTFAEHQGAVYAVAFSPDGKLALTAGADGKAILWDAGKGDKLRALPGHKQAIQAAAFSRDGRQLLTGSGDQTAIVWDTDSGGPLSTLSGHKGSVTAVAFHPDGRPLTASEDQTAILWHATGARPVQTYQGPVRTVTALALDRDSGRRLLVGTEDSAALAWDLAAGRPQRPLNGPGSSARAVALSSGGSDMLVGFADGTALLWQPGHSGPRPLEDKSSPASSILAVALSPDGKRAAVGCSNGQVRLHATDSGTVLHSLNGHSGDAVNALAFSADGKQLVSGSDDRTAILWDVETGAQVCSFKGHGDAVRAVAIRADGKQVLTGSADRTAQLWDAQTGKSVLTLNDRADRINGVAFSSDGRQVLTTAAATATLWDVEGHTALRTFSGHEGEIRAAVLGPNDRLVITGGEDGTVRLWDVATGEELARLLGLDGGKDWLVLAADGLFDGSAPGREKVMFRVRGAEMPVAVERFFQSLFREGLLAQAWCFQHCQPATQAVGTRPPPTLHVYLDPPCPAGKAPQRDVTVRVEARDTGGGISGLTLRHNGAVVLRVSSEAKEASATMIRKKRIKLLNGKNHLVVEAASAEGWASDALRLDLEYRTPLPRSKVELYVLTVGIKDYKAPEHRKGVSYAAKDARDLADVFARRARKSGLYGDVHVAPLLDARATRKGILAEIDRMAQASREEDVFILFLAGHGAQYRKQYYFLPYEMPAREGGGVTPTDLEQAVSITELREHVDAVKAKKKLLIFDTCHAGAALQRLSTADVPADAALRGAIERLNRATGTYWIAGVADDEQAWDHEHLEHGLFTYAVLEGLGAVQVKSGGEPKGGIVYVLELCRYASAQSPELYQRFRLRTQQPVLSTPEASSDFPLLPARDP